MEINVLSLFDGMSCGQIALERANINVNNYYASEIDKHAIKVTQSNYPNTIQLGDVKRKEYEEILNKTEGNNLETKMRRKNKENFDSSNRRTTE